MTERIGFTLAHLGVRGPAIRPHLLPIHSFISKGSSRRRSRGRRRRGGEGGGADEEEEEKREEERDGEGQGEGEEVEEAQEKGGRGPGRGGRGGSVGFSLPLAPPLSTPGVRSEPHPPPCTSPHLPTWQPPFPSSLSGSSPVLLLTLPGADILSP